MQVMSGFKVVIAPDSFKGTLRATQVCEIWSRAFRENFPKAELACLPMADGGEGCLDAIFAATGAQSIEAHVSDPLGRTVIAHWAKLPDGTAFIEAAEANGIERLAPSERNPMAATTYGVGQLIKSALESGVGKITIGIGGSATVEGGAGMLQALGYRLLDEQGNDIAHGGAGIATIKSVVPAELPSFELNIACDVVNPLLGAQGTCRVFAPQKGANSEMVEELENAMRHYAGVLVSAGIASCCDAPGDGAAGGLGFALRGVLGGRMRSGAKLFADMVRLRERLEGASLLITGEGCSDGQTLYGKLPSVVAEIALEKGVPSILCSGAVNDAENALRKRFSAVFGTTMKPVPLQEALDNAEENLYRTACSIAKVLAIGYLNSFRK